jgi:hypothetical protein
MYKRWDRKFISLTLSFETKQGQTRLKFLQIN